MKKSLLLPMNCTAIRKKLSAFEDGEVSSPLRFEIEAHLATCPDCLQALADLQHLWLALEDAVQPRLRPDFSQEVMRKITEQSESRLFNWTWALDYMFPAPAAMAAMVVLGLLTGGWMGRATLEGRMTAATAPMQAATLEALDAFAPTPKGSLAQGYLLLVSDATQVTR
jgi:anti-sigma factor RsiW